jgi:hypothetical protein
MQLSEKCFEELFRWSLMPVCGHGKDVRLSDKRFALYSGVVSGGCLKV